MRCDSAPLTPDLHSVKNGWARFWAHRALSRAHVLLGRQRTGALSPTLGNRVSAITGGQVACYLWFCVTYCQESHPDDVSDDDKIDASERALMTHPSFRLKSWLRAGASVAGIAWLMGGPPAVAATPQPQYTGDLIIKWRDDTSGTRKTLSAAESGNRLLSVAQTAGSTLQVKRTLGTQAQLMHTGLTDATSIEATAAKIAQD